MHRLSSRYGAFEFKFDVLHRARVKRKAADALSRRPTDEEDRTNLNYALPVFMIVPMDNAKELEGNDERHDMLNEGLNVIAPGFHVVLNMATTSTGFSKPRTTKFSAKQAKDSFCCQPTSTVRAPGSNYYYNLNGFLIYTSPIDVAKQKVISLLLQARILHVYHQPPLAAHPSECIIYHTMWHGVNWPHMVNDVYTNLTDWNECIRNRSKNKQTRRLKIFRATGPLAWIALDTLGRLSKTVNATSSRYSWPIDILSSHEQSQPEKPELPTSRQSPTTIRSYLTGYPLTFWRTTEHNLWVCILKLYAVSLGSRISQQLHTTPRRRARQKDTIRR